MAQDSTYILDNIDRGAASRSKLNSIFAAIKTLNSGGSQPPNPSAYMLWADTATEYLKIRDASNANWITLLKLDSVGGLLTNAGNPNGAVTGQFEGQQLYDTTNDLLYVYSGAGTVWLRQARFSELGSINESYSVRTATPYTVLTTDNYLEWNGVANGTFNLYAVSGNAGKTLKIKNITTQYRVTLDGNASETIDGALTLDIWPGQSVMLYCNGTNWQTIKEQGKGRVLIQEQVVSSPVASVDFISGINSNFRNYEIDLIDVKPSTDDAGLYCRTSSNGGSSYDAGASDYNQSGLMVWSNATTNASTISAQNTSQGFLTPVGGTIGVSATANEAGYSGKLTMFDPSNTSRFKQFIGSAGYNLSSDNFNVLCQVAFVRKSASVVNALRFFFSSGNIAVGTFRLYGVN